MIPAATRICKITAIRSVPLTIEGGRTPFKICLAKRFTISPAIKAIRMIRGCFQFVRLICFLSLL